MANVDAPFGFRPVRHLNGSPWNGQTERCYISASYAVALFVGDAVTLQTATACQDATGKHLSIMIATAGDSNPILGVITSFEPLPSGLDYNYNPASTERYANVCIDPTVIFHIQDDASATPTKLLCFQNANFATTHAGSTATGISGMELDLTTPAANDSFQLLILKVAGLPNNTLAVNAIWEVLINHHHLRCTSTSDAATPVGMCGVTAT